MLTSILWRSIWKEYRGQLGLWTSLCGIAFAIQLMIATVRMFDEFVLASALTNVAVFMPLFFLLAHSATAFAGEHENETIDFLPCCPVGRSLSIGQSCRCP